MCTPWQRERFMGLPRMLTRVHEFPGVMDRPWQSNTPNMPKLGINSSNKDTPNVKKRHRRAKSGGVKNVDQGAGDGRKPTLLCTIVSLCLTSWLITSRFCVCERDNRKLQSVCMPACMLIKYKGEKFSFWSVHVCSNLT